MKVPDFSGKKRDSIETESRVITSEEEVVEMVNKWRLNDTPEINRSAKDEGGKSKELKKDNVAPEEVVEIIQIHRIELREKAQNTMTGLNGSTSPVDIATKMREWQKVYLDTGNKMEWDAINTVAVEEAQEKQNLEGVEETNNWLKKQANVTLVKKRVIEIAEQQNDIEQYMTLNDDFTKRLEDVNRYQDEKEVGDKRPVKESPQAPLRKSVLVDTNEDTGDESKEESEGDIAVEETQEETVKMIKPNATNNQQIKKKKKRGKK